MVIVESALGAVNMNSNLRAWVESPNENKLYINYIKKRISFQTCAANKDTINIFL